MSRCKLCHNKWRSLHNRRLKEEIVDFMGGRCCKCGYSKYIGALELHHINPSEKDPNYLGLKNRKFEAIKSELEKCILVCSNCHKEIHSDLVGSSPAKAANYKQRKNNVKQRYG